MTQSNVTDVRDIKTLLTVTFIAVLESALDYSPCGQLVHLKL